MDDEKDLEELSYLNRIVPVLPESLIDDVNIKLISTRENIIKYQRITTLIPLMRENNYPTILLPTKSHFFSAIHTPPDEKLTVISPLQIQYVSMLINYVYKNPSYIIKVLENQQKKDPYNFFSFMIYSVIPSFFGFFSSYEHINNAFSFYCMLINMSNYDVIDHALVPFYCNGCTFRFTEMIYYIFGLEFCHDATLCSDKIEYQLLKRYVTPLINAIIQAFPLLPHAHIFLLKYMIRKGRDPKSVLHFFLHKFTFPQLLRYVKGTPFTSHFSQLKAIAIFLMRNVTPSLPILDVLNSQSVFELPSAFTMFDYSFTQLLLTPLDVHMMLLGLQNANLLPINLKIFIESSYFQNLTLIPFWVKYYPKSPLPMSTAFNWRPVVFMSIKNITEQKKSNSIVEPSLSMERNNDYERIYRQFRSSKSAQDLLDVIKQYKDEKHKEFKAYMIKRERENFVEQELIFERYLVHSISLQSLVKWYSIVEAAYTAMVFPVAHSHVSILLRKKVIPTIENIEMIVENSMQGANSPFVRQVLYMMTINHILNNIVPPQLIQKLENISKQWNSYVNSIRETIPSPFMFSSNFNKNSKNLNNSNDVKPIKNDSSIVLLNKKLWEAINHLKCIEFIKFEWSLKLILDSLSQMDELIRIDSRGGTEIIQYAIAMCDCPLILTIFILINVFVVKQKAFKTMTNESRDFFLWSSLESAIIKLMGGNEKLMVSFLEFQDELVAYQIE